MPLDKKVEMLERAVEILMAERRAFVGSDKYIAQKDFFLADGRAIKFSANNGGYIGKNPTDRIGFWGVNPVDQPATVSDPTRLVIGGTGDDANINTNFSNLETAVEAIIDRLQEAGIIAT